MFRFSAAAPGIDLIFGILVRVGERAFTILTSVPLCYWETYVVRRKRDMVCVGSFRWRLCLLNRFKRNLDAKWANRSYLIRQLRGNRIIGLTSVDSAVDENQTWRLKVKWLVPWGDSQVEPRSPRLNFQDIKEFIPGPLQGIFYTKSNSFRSMRPVPVIGIGYTLQSAPSTSDVIGLSRFATPTGRMLIAPCWQLLMKKIYPVSTGRPKRRSPVCKKQLY